MDRFYTHDVCGMEKKKFRIDTPSFAYATSTTSPVQLTPCLCSLNLKTRKSNIFLPSSARPTRTPHEEGRVQVSNLGQEERVEMSEK
jgi:hypothetical protein